LNGTFRKSIILGICILPMLLTICYQVPVVHADNWWTTLTVRTDVNLDLRVDMKDIGVVAKAFGTRLGYPLWNADCDINSDGLADMKDLGNVAKKFGWVGETPPTTTLIVSSTSSLYETKVEDEMKTVFQSKYPWITLNFLSQGTGAAIQTAIRGDADMIMVHDPLQENTFLTNGYGVNRKIIACNFFIIVGPQGDPANIAGMTPLDALRQTKTLGQQGQALWVSRGDGSGTHGLEKRLWAAAGINWTEIRTETSWFKETGQTMTPTLLVADELGGYTLADTASYLTNTRAGNIQMEIVVQAGRELLNVYSMIVDNPLNANLTDTNFVASMLFVHFVVSEEGQNLLANYGTSTFGAPLFTPFIPLAKGGNNTLLEWIQSYAYINGTECPAAYRYDASSLYSNVWDN
jgi:tungstate transport system substrate-binding protein